MNLPVEILISAMTIYLPFLGIALMIIRKVRIGYLSAFLPYLLLAVFNQSLQFFYRTPEISHFYCVLEFIAVSYLLISWDKVLRIPLIIFLGKFGIIISVMQLSDLEYHNVYALLLQSLVLIVASLRVLYIILRYRIGEINYTKLLIVTGLLFYYFGNLISFSMYNSAGTFPYILHSYVNTFTNILLGASTSVQWHHKLTRVSFSS